MTNQEKINFYLKDLPSPLHFLKANYLFCVSSALGRKTWIGSKDFAIFPNLYLIFIGAPAVGKSLPAIRTRTILNSLEYHNKILNKMCKTVCIHPQAATYESMLNNIQDTYRSEKIPDGPEGKLLVHSSMVMIMEEELATLFRKHTEDTIAFLTAGYNCGDVFDRTTKHQGKDNLINICLNFMACCTPDWMEDSVNDSLIGYGFTSRIIFIWGENPRPCPLFIETNKEQKAALEEVKKHLNFISRNVGGQLKFTPDAYAYTEELCQKTVIKPSNPEKKLEHYYGRWKQHLEKLIIACHFAEKTSLILEKDDVEEAYKFLIFLEKDMHKALGGIQKNPIKPICDRLMKSLESGPKLEGQLYIDLIESVTGMEQIADAINFLMKTGQIKMGIKGSKTVYEKIINE